jgi:tyrosyl-tRNA synthetase
VVHQSSEPPSAVAPVPPGRAAGTPGGTPVSPAVVAALEVLTSGTAQVLPAGALQGRLIDSERTGVPLRVKLGIDPSGSELTLGHAVVLRKLRQFQDLGHIAVLIVGDFTGQVGDPTGRSQVRSILTHEQTLANSASYFEQVMRILRPDRLEVVRNSDWLASMTMSDVLREARELTVARLLERDDFARRHKAQESISLVEFLYPLLQGYDSVAVRADVELGGTDQTYNLLIGRDLQRAHGQAEQVVLTVPLLVGIDGVAKMGKSLGNYVSITHEPGEMFGRLMRIPDAAVGTYARLTTDLPPQRCTQLEEAAGAGGPAAAQAKREVARTVVGLYHGPPAAGVAEERFDAVFRRGEVPPDVATTVLGPAPEVHLPALLCELGFAPSRGAARRLIGEGAVRLDGEPVQMLDVSRTTLQGRVLSAGKRRQIRLVDPPQSP